MTTTDQRHVRNVEQQPAAADQAEDAYIHYDHIGHGSTPAAWTLSLTIVLGSVIAASDSSSPTGPSPPSAARWFRWASSWGSC